MRRHLLHWAMARRVALHKSRPASALDCAWLGEFLARPSRKMHVYSDGQKLVTQILGCFRNASRRKKSLTSSLLCQASAVSRDGIVHRCVEDACNAVPTHEILGRFDVLRDSVLNLCARTIGHRLRLDIGSADDSDSIFVGRASEASVRIRFEMVRKNIA